MEQSFYTGLNTTDRLVFSYGNNRKAVYGNEVFESSK